MRKFLSLNILVFLFTLCIGTVFHSTTAQAALDRCSRHEVKTSLKAKRMKTQFKRATFRDINAYLGEHSVLAFVEHKPLDLRARYSFHTEAIGNGMYCVKLDSVQAFFIMQNTIVMPLEYKRNSCEYKIILEHEKRHLAENYIFHEEYTKKFQTYLGRIAKYVPIYPPAISQVEVERTQQKIMEYFENEYYSLMQTAFNELNKLQNKIDSPQEYLYTNRRIDRCNALAAEQAKSNSKVFYDR